MASRNVLGSTQLMHKEAKTSGNEGRSCCLCHFNTCVLSREANPEALESARQIPTHLPILCSLLMGIQIYFSIIHQPESFRTSIDFDVTVTKGSLAVYIADRSVCEGDPNGGGCWGWWC